IFTGLIWWNTRLLYLNDVARAQAERRLAAQHNSTRVLAESPNLTSAMPRILAIICEGLGWQVGAFWTADSQANLLRCAEFWQSPSIRNRDFLENSRRTTFGKGLGFLGRVWSEGRPRWLSDVLLERDFVRKEAAAKAG